MALLRLRSLSPVAMAQHARRHTDHYAKAFAGWNGRVFEDLPLLTKEQARSASPYDFLARTYARKVRYYAETTGSVGSPTPSFFTPREFHAATLLAKITPYHDLLLGALDANRTCLNGLTMGFTIAGLSFGDLMANLGGLVANAGSRSTLATPERIARALVRLKPSVVASTPGDLLAWMRIVKEDYPAEYGAVVDSLKVLLSTAELCAQSRVRRIEEHFGITHVDVYACVEGFFSLPCPCGSKHVLPAYHVEVFDDDLGRIGEVGTGRFVFTNLLKRSTPMVRYLLDDLVTIESCECPYGFERSVVPHGRYELTVRGATGRIGTRHVEEAIFRRGLFGDYRLVIEDDGAHLTLESYGEAEGDPGLEDILGTPVRLERVAYGALTDFRAVRESKPILRLDDRRNASDQSVPQHL